MCASRPEQASPVDGESSETDRLSPRASVACGDRTAVTWTMTGHNNFIAKAICLFMNIDKTVVGNFEKGLANLKAVVESARQT